MKLKQLLIGEHLTRRQQANDNSIIYSSRAARYVPNVAKE